MGLLLKRRAWTALTREVAAKKRRRRLLLQLTAHFRKFQLFHAVRKVHLQTNRLAAVRDKSKIDGAFLLLKRFKNRLKAFDTALHAMDRSKVNQNEFNELCTSIDKERSRAIFDDMKRLFDS